MQLYIGNKNYSSWSLRPWLTLTQLGIEFEEKPLRLDFTEGSAFKATLQKLGGSGKVPLLVDDGFAVWETLAIIEYVAERFPAQRVWPRDTRERARARSLCSEMHSGFSELRNQCPMNIEASLPQVGQWLWAENDAVRRDVARIEQLWLTQLQHSGGPFLFGEFCAADAFFAPVCSRVRTYGLPLSNDAKAYADRLWSLPAMRQWEAAALREKDFLDFDEPYRNAPG